MAIRWLNKSSIRISVLLISVQTFYVSIDASVARQVVTQLGIFLHAWWVSSSAAYKQSLRNVLTHSTTTLQIKEATQYSKTQNTSWSPIYLNKTTFLSLRCSFHKSNHFNQVVDHMWSHEVYYTITVQANNVWQHFNHLIFFQ